MLSATRYLAIGSTVLTLLAPATLVAAPGPIGGHVRDDGDAAAPTTGEVYAADADLDSGGRRLDRSAAVSLQLPATSPVPRSRVSLGFWGGVSIPNLTAGSDQNPVSTGYRSRLGPDVAVFGEVALSRRFSLQTALQYSSQGGQKNGLQALEVPDALAALFPAGQAPPYLYANFQSEAKLNYLLIPVLATFSHARASLAMRVYAAAGPFLGVLLSATQVTSGQSPLFLDAAGATVVPAGTQSFDSTTDITDSLRRINSGLEGHVGVAHRWGTGELFLQAGGNYGFVNIQKNAQSGKNRTGAASLTAGYRYRLGR